MKEWNKLLKQRLLKKMVLLTMLLALIGSSMAWAEETPAPKFSDVSVNWAYKHISKLALHGVINGRSATVFAPNDSVSQQDVIVMAVSLMGATVEELEEASNDPLPLQVDGYARKFVAVGLRTGLLNIDEELEARKSAETKDSWGKMTASREWVAKVTIRAIGKQAQANVLASTPSMFVDAEDITKGFSGYINAAVQLEIVSGMPGNRFAPKDQVTRAQMAVFLSKAERYLETPLAATYEGMILRTSPNELVIIDAEGEEHTFSTTGQTLYFSTTINDKTIRSSDLEVYYPVYVIAKNGAAHFVEMADEAVKMETLAGVIVDTSAASHELVVQGDSQSQMFTIGDATVISDANGNTLKIDQLVVGSKVEALWSATDAGVQLLELYVLEVPVNKSDKGVIYALDTNSSQVSFVISGSQQQESYKATNGLQVVYKDKAIGGIDKLANGDVVEFRVENSVITSITLLEPLSPIIEKQTGKLTSLNATDRTISLLTADNRLQAYFIATGAAVELEGKNGATLADLVINDALEVDVDGNQVVQKIKIMNRKIAYETMATLVSFDKASMQLAVQLRDSTQWKVFKLKPETMIQDTALRDWQDELLKNILIVNQKVDLFHTGEEVMEVGLSNGYEGTIEKVDLTTLTLTIRSAKYGQIVVPWNANTKLERQGGVLNWSQLTVGQPVRILLNGMRNAAQSVQLVENVGYWVVSKDDNKRQITVSDTLGKLSTITVPQGQHVQHASGVAYSIAQLSVHQPVFVSYAGGQVLSVTAAESVLGEVTAVDDLAVTVSKFDGTSIRLEKNKLVKIQKSGSAAFTYQELRVGDRVAYVQTAEGNMYLTAAQVETRTFLSYDAATQKLTFAKRNTSEPTPTYSYASGVQIKVAGQTSFVDSLKRNTAVNLYLINGQMIALEAK